MTPSYRAGGGILAPNAETFALKAAPAVEMPSMKINPVRVLLLASVTVFFAVFGTGCNTVQGAGKDIEKAGDKIQDAAK